MKHLPNLLLIGGSSRNTGKTTLALRLIRKYAGLFPVTGLKVTSIRPGEHDFHGNHHLKTGNRYHIHRETNINGQKDTERMLAAGADAVYFIETPDSLITSAFDTFISKLKPGSLIICESRNLRDIVIPGLFILLRHWDKTLVKPGFEKYESLADYIFEVPENSKFSDSPEAARIQTDGSKWEFKV